MERWRLFLTGTVQGVGFRPSLFRLAAELGLSGLVFNSPAGVTVEIQGDQTRLEEFHRRILAFPPPRASIKTWRVDHIPCLTVADPSFSIVSSRTETAAEACIPPDLALCNDCREEMWSPGNRRYIYPFINCTNCGPRYSIAEAVPYDRPNTTMAGFALCPDCRREYEDPLNRRFHAQPVSCPRCGPSLQLFRVRDGGIPRKAPAKDPIALVRAALKRGKVVALKSPGGFHLACDATNDEAVRRIRALKSREEKPLALLCRDLAHAGTICLVTEEDAACLASAAAPIVIMPSREAGAALLSDRIAPGQDRIGVMLPNNPLQEVLIRFYPHPLVMTSCNLEDEPLAREMPDLHPSILAGIDYVLTNDRGIAARCDDSVLIASPMNIPIRRARGFVPEPIAIPTAGRQALGMGGDMKNTACYIRGDRALLTPHVGNLENERMLEALRGHLEKLGTMFSFRPEVVGCDPHPRYESRRLAYSLGLRVQEVQHHHAHIAACMAENMLARKVIGVAFDGTGYGPDGTIWGGEFLVAHYGGYTRAGCLRPMPLPGGERAIREPWRMAVAYLRAAYGSALPSFPGCEALYGHGAALLAASIRSGYRPTITTTSAGRLFDAAAAMIAGTHTSSFEGQAAMALETLARQGKFRRDPYRCDLDCKTGLVRLDFSPAIRRIVEELCAGKDKGGIAMAFHRTVALGVRLVCEKISERTGLKDVVLTGGVFQNSLLLPEAIDQLRWKDFVVHYHRKVPSNDGGISLGQAVVAAYAAD